MARNEANTKPSTTRAPTPPRSASTSTPGPPAAPALVLEGVEAAEAAPARPATVAPVSAARSLLLGLRVVAEGLVGVGRRVGDDEGRPPVLGHERRGSGRGVAGDAGARQGAGRGGARRRRRPARTRRRVDRLAGRAALTTGTSGALLPPVPRKARAMAMLVVQPSLPGTENFCFSALVADPADAMPDEGHDDPEDGDEALVCEDPSGDLRHRRSTSITVRGPNDFYHKSFAARRIFTCGRAARSRPSWAAFQATSWPGWARSPAASFSRRWNPPVCILEISG